MILDLYLYPYNKLSNILTLILYFNCYRKGIFMKGDNLANIGIRYGRQGKEDSSDWLTMWIDCVVYRVQYGSLSSHFFEHCPPKESHVIEEAL